MTEHHQTTLLCADECEPFPLIATINVIDDYVIFEDGTRCEIEQYLNGLDEVIENGEDAWECIVKHPAYDDFLVIEIEPLQVTVN